MKSTFRKACVLYWGAHLCFFNLLVCDCVEYHQSLTFAFVMGNLQ
jgi:hypothetical protein